MSKKGKTVIVTGASGLLGRAILKVFEEDGWNAVGTGLSHADPPRIRKVDLTDLKALEQLIDEVNPSVIVHSAAEKKFDLTENPQWKDELEKLNVKVPEFLGTITRDRGILLIYISTDYVFDGTNPPYYPDSKPNPLNAYGKSKLQGEDAALSANPDSGISLRVPVLYGEGEGSESAVNILVDQVMNKSQKAKIEMDNVASRFPTECGDVGRCIRDLSNMYITDPSRFSFPEILQFSNSQRMTKYDMALKFGEILGVPTDHLVRVDTIDEKLAVNRPKDSQLDVGRLRELGINVQNVDFESWWRRKLGAFRH